MGCKGSKENNPHGVSHLHNSLILQQKKLKDILADPKDVEVIKQNAVKQFKEADKDGSGFLDFKEFEESCKTYNKRYSFPEPSPQQVKEAMIQFDKNKDGKLSLEEYQNMILEVLRVLAKLEDS